MPGEERTGVGRRRFLSLAGGAAGSAALAGCSGVLGNDPTGGTTTDTSSGNDSGGATETESGGDGADDGEGGAFPIRITQGQVPQGLDPHDHRQTPAKTVLLHCYQGVLSTDRHGRIVEGLATNYRRMENGNRVRFDVREDVSFHDGSSLTPEDVVFSVERVADDATGFSSPQRDQLDGVTDAAVVDGERSVEVRSSGVDPVVFTTFASYCDVLSKEWVQSHDRSYIASNAMGTGPFVLESYESGSRVEFSRFEDYWGDRPAASAVSFSAETDPVARIDALLEGEVDVAVGVPPAGVRRINDGTRARVEVAPSTRLLFTGMRDDTQPFDSVAFRRALNYAVDLESVVGNVLQGFGEQTGQPTLEGFTGHNPDVEPYPYDPERAEQLVEQSGYAGAEITLHVPTGRYLKGFEIAQSVVGYVDELSNVSATVERRGFQSLASDLLSPTDSDDPAWYLIGWNEPTADGVLVMRPLLTSDGRLSTWSNEAFDRLLTQASSQTGDERVNTLRDANQLAHDRAPWVFLNRQYSVYGVSSAIDWRARTDERVDAAEMRRSE
ncbi:ABC transporter substrate-binding protein [Halobium salinum]|uniref:ABC transporter substrate-binding protein n=1 Tax=Halobium salinum TaxID=1364940 RepID=A0ABD5P9U0_9EURY|nr:ABC transporter substrate-binding protein [Halobium salinum]